MTIGAMQDRLLKRVWDTVLRCPTGLGRLGSMSRLQVKITIYKEEGMPQITDPKLNPEVIRIINACRHTNMEYDYTRGAWECSSCGLVISEYGVQRILNRGVYAKKFKPIQECVHSPEHLSECEVQGVRFIICNHCLAMTPKENDVVAEMVNA